MAGCQFVLAAFSGQQRPASAFSPLNKRSPILSLPVSVVIVTVPGWANRRVHLEHSVDDTQGVHDQRVVGPSYSIVIT